MPTHRETRTSPAIEARSLSKTFGDGRSALQGVNLLVAPGEMVALIGASGAGKSTLLQHLAGLMACDSGSDGSVHVHGRAVQMQGRFARDIRALRAGIGFVSQHAGLAGGLPVIGTVLTGLQHRMPLWRRLTRRFTPAETALGIAALRRVGLAECAMQRSSTLSRGQQQRAAVARMVVQGARVVLADDPLASLDPGCAGQVMDVLSALNSEAGCTVVVSLHQVDVALRYCPRTVALHRGEVVYDGPSTALPPALLRRLYGAAADGMIAADDAACNLDEPRAPRNTSSWGQAALRAV